ncbi:MAG: HAMP domain-containing sensor histidine kinase [Desulfobacterales bacterium]|jgi:signal transduction histidine kinase
MEGDRHICVETTAYLQNRASVLFFLLTNGGKIVETNQYAKTIVGRHLIGENIQDVIVDFKNTFHLPALIKDPSKEHLLNISTASGLPQSFYFWFKKVLGQIVVFGRPDAEELENMQKELVSLNQELNNLTRELHKTNAQLKRLNQEKNRFLGMAAHDLRKPIGLIISYSEFLLEEAKDLLDADQVGFLNAINASGVFMKHLVDDFLDVSAIEAGKFELDLQPAFINEILANSLRLNKLRANKKGIDLQVNSDESLPRIIIDASKIEQAMTNLVSNAIEHTSPNSPVSISLSCDQQFMIFAVKDEGPGMAPEEMDMLFKPFAKTNAKKTAGEKSTGLGMLITRKVIDAHGGKIWINSRVGEGTTVYFKIPTQNR